MKKLLYILCLLLTVTLTSRADNLKVLFIGSDSSSELPSFLDQIVGSDTSLNESTTSEFYKIDYILQGYYAGRSMPSDTTDFLNKIDEGFDYIFILPDEEKIYHFPGTYLEEVRLIRNRVSKLGTKIILPVIWGHEEDVIDAVEFEDHSYRIGDALNVKVVPAGLAWKKVLLEQSSLLNSSSESELTEAASYLLANSVYTEIFQKSGVNSTFTPASMNEEEKGSIVSHVYQEWLTAPQDTHYVGEYTKGYCSPNQIDYDVNNTSSVFMGSSTENGYGSKYREILLSGGYDAGRTHISRYKYSPQSVFPGLMDATPVDPGTEEVRDILANNHFDFGFARFYALRAHHIQDFQETSLNSEIPFIGYRYQAYPAPTFAKQLNIIYDNVKDGSAFSRNINRDLGAQKVFHIPAEIAWGRLWELDPSLVEFKGVHVSDQVDAAVASMLYTLLSDENCNEFGNPNSSGPHQAGYELAQNIGYRIIQELGSLKSVPYEVANTKPAAVINNLNDDLGHSNNFGGGIYYLLDHDEDGVENIDLNGVNSFDYEGEVTSYSWSHQGSVISTNSTLSQSLEEGFHTVSLNVEDDLSQTSPTSDMLFAVLDSDTLVFDEMEQPVNGGYGWEESEWQWDGSTQVRWESKIVNKGKMSMNIQNSGVVSRSFDLSSETENLFLEFSYFARSFESSEEAYIEIYDGSWHTLLIIGDTMDDQKWHDVKYDISHFNKVEDFQIKITMFGNANNDDLFIDSFKVYRYHVPVAVSDSVITVEDQELEITLKGSDEDGDDLSFNVLSLPNNGSISGVAPNLIYTPNSGYVGPDSFTFSVHDGHHTSETAMIQITVEAANIPPVAHAGENQMTADLDGDGGELITLDASQSHDEDGEIESYIWEKGASLLTTGEQSTISLSSGNHDIRLTVTDDDGASSFSDVNIFIEAYDPRTAPKLSNGVLESVNENWQTVVLPKTYDSMVVIATPQYDLSSIPLVTRIRNAADNQFEIKVQNPSGNISFDGIPVHYIVLEEGIYNQTEHGVKMEVVKYTSSRTDFRGNLGLKGEQKAYTNSYDNPVVIGQIMSNQDDWSTFWARGASRGEKPSSQVLYTGKLVSEDPDRTRLDETIGYIVFEAGVTVLDGVNIQTGITDNFVRNPWNYTHTTSLNVGTVVTSPAGINGANGGWPIIKESPEANSFMLLFDEDQIGDDERIHTREEVAFMVIEGL